MTVPRRIILYQGVNEARIGKTHPATEQYFIINDNYYIPAGSLLWSLLQGAGVWAAELSTPVP